MIYFLLILIVITLIFGREAGLWVLGISGAGFLILVGLAIYHGNPELFSTIEAVVGVIFLLGWAVYGMYVTCRGFKSGKYTIKKMLPYVIGTIIFFIALTLGCAGIYFFLK